MKIVKILIGFLFAIIVGNLFASAIDVSPFITVPGLFALGFIPKPAGVLFFDFANLDWADGTENMGGLQVIGYFAPISYIDNFPKLPTNPSTAIEEVTLESVTGFTMQAGKYFRRIYSTMETSKVEDEPQGELDGQSFIQKATTFYPGTKVEAMAFARNVNNSNMVFIFIDTQGDRRVIGSEEFPARCKPAVTTGEKTADRKGMTMEVFSYGYTPAPFYTGKIHLESGVIS
jgi:hypothetical protein